MYLSLKWVCPYSSPVFMDKQYESEQAKAHPYCCVFWRARSYRTFNLEITIIRNPKYRNNLLEKSFRGRIVVTMVVVYGYPAPSILA